jgi:nucleoporin NUP82
MPKVKCYSAAWLSKNAPGNQLFEPSAESLRSRALSSPSRKKQVPGPRRNIARRGTEAFVAVGKEIRWGDLVYLKEEWTDKQSRRRSSSSVRVKREDDTLQSIDTDITDTTAGWRVSLWPQKNKIMT